jgi:hypothetical protein
MSQPIHVTIRLVDRNVIDLSLCRRQYRMTDRARTYLLDQCKALLIPYVGTPITLINGLPDLTVPSYIVDAHLEEAQRQGWLFYHKHTQSWGIYLCQSGTPICLPGHWTRAPEVPGRGRPLAGVPVTGGKCGPLIRNGSCPTCRQALAHPTTIGLYRLYWKDGGFSLAAVGMASNGDMWFAPVNWCDGGLAHTDWDRVAGWEPVDDGLIKNSKDFTPPGL